MQLYNPSVRTFVFSFILLIVYRSLIPWFLCGRRSGFKLSLQRSLVCFLANLSFLFLPLLDPAPTEKHKRVVLQKSAIDLKLWSGFRNAHWKLKPKQRRSFSCTCKTGFTPVHRKARVLTVWHEPIKSLPYCWTATWGEGLYTQGFKKLVRIEKPSCFLPAKHLTLLF